MWKANGPRNTVNSNGAVSLVSSGGCNTLPYKTVCCWGAKDQVLQHISQRLQVPEAALPGGKGSSNQSSKLLPAENARNTFIWVELADSRRVASFALEVNVLGSVLLLTFRHGCFPAGDIPHQSSWPECTRWHFKRLVQCLPSSFQSGHGEFVGKRGSRNRSTVPSTGKWLRPLHTAAVQIIAGLVPA